METAKAQLKHTRIAPRKVRLLADLVRGMPVREAEARLLLSAKRASVTLLKVLRGAVSNARNKEMSEEKLFIKEIRVNEGATLKRFIPRARGSATPIMKRTSHINIILEEDEKIRQPGFTFIKKEKASDSSDPVVAGEEKNQDVPAKAGNQEADAAPKEVKKAGKQIDAKGAAKKGGKKTFFRRKSV